MKKEIKSDKKTKVNALFEALSEIKTVEEARAFLLDLCTPAELEAMTDRYQVVDLLKQGIPYRQIHDATGVSVTTVSRVARTMMFGTGGYNLIYERVKGKKDE